jgi:DNA repair protein RecO (recombination protein O)
MTLVTTDALVLHTFDYLESSRIIRMATRETGLVSVLARGARSAKRGFGLGLDLFASGVAQLHVRAGRELHALGGFDLTSARGAIATDLGRFAAASAVAELALRFAAGGEPGELFAELTHAFDRLASAPPPAAIDEGLAAGWHLVVVLGFAPAVDHCARCRSHVDPSLAVTFSHAAGGATCANCAGGVPRGRVLPPDARLALERWTAGQAHPLPDDVARRAHLRLLREFLEQHLGDGRPLRALASWERQVAGAGAGR